MKKFRRRMGVLILAVMLCFTVTGCSVFEEQDEKDKVLSENVVITETGEVIEKYPQPGSQEVQEPETSAPEIEEQEGAETQGENPEAEDASRK